MCHRFQTTKTCKMSLWLIPSLGKWTQGAVLPLQSLKWKVHQQRSSQRFAIMHHFWNWMHSKEPQNAYTKLYWNINDWDFCNLLITSPNFHPQKMINGWWIRASFSSSVIPKMLDWCMLSNWAPKRVIPSREDGSFVRNRRVSDYDWLDRACIGLWIEKIGFFPLGTPAAIGDALTFQPLKPPSLHLWYQQKSLLGAYKYIDTLNHLPSTVTRVSDKLGKHTSLLSENLGTICYEIREYEYSQDITSITEECDQDDDKSEPGELLIKGRILQVGLDPELIWAKS